MFLDCGPCDFDYLRREIEFIDYVRDRKDADVHVLVTTQPTGAGGTEYVFKFIGLGRFAGVDDELKFTALETYTRDERRVGYARVFKLGLVRYVTSTNLADRLDLTFQPVDDRGRGAADRAERSLGFLELPAPRQRLGQRRTPDQLPQLQRVGLREPHHGRMESELRAST